MRRGHRLIPGVLCGGGLVVALAHAQLPDRENQFLERQTRALAEPFRGVTTDGQIVPGLFAIHPTGLSTAGGRRAAQAFLASLTEAQRRNTIFPIDDPEWRRWDNVPSPPSPPRFGVRLDEMSEHQRQLAFELIGASLSAKGLKQTQDTMKLNATLAEITQDKRFGRWFYSMTVMGTPSDNEPWGWQLDGHHLAINYFVLGDQVVMTPTFMGAEPAHAKSGPFAGTSVLQNEQDNGFRLYVSLTKDQQAEATLSTQKGRADNLGAAYQDNLVLDYAGILVTDLQDSQRRLLLDLINEHVANLPRDQARLRMDEVTRHLDRTYFAWIGSGEPGAVFYYRIQSPVILIEFDHQSPARFPNDSPTRDHIHTIVRTPNGNDYGKDLLRQHYAQHPHTQQ